MKRKTFKCQLFFTPFLIILNIGCNAILHLNPYAEKYNITLQEAENLGNCPVTLAASRIEVSYMYDSYLLRNDTIWSVVSNFNLSAGMKQTLVAINEFEFDSNLLSKASIIVRFIGDELSGRPVMGTQACSGQRMIQINAICTNFNKNGFGGDNVEGCYYLDVNYTTYPYSGTMRFKYTIQPVYD